MLFRSWLRNLRSKVLKEDIDTTKIYKASQGGKGSMLSALGIPDFNYSLDKSGNVILDQQAISAVRSSMTNVTLQCNTPQGDNRSFNVVFNKNYAQRLADTFKLATSKPNSQGQGYCPTYVTGFKKVRKRSQPNDPLPIEQRPLSNHSWGEIGRAHV